MNRSLLNRVSFVAMAAVVLACAAATCNAAPPEVERELLAAYVPPDFGDESALATGLRRHIVLSDSENWTVTTAPRQKLSEGQRWVRFEDEFGVQERSESWMLSGIQSAKYQLDRTVFALDVMVENVERAVRMEYDLSRGTMHMGETYRPRAPLRTFADPWRDVWENARLKSDVDLDVFSGRAWVGLRLVFPIGD